MDLWRVSYILLSDNLEELFKSHPKVFISYEAFIAYIKYLIDNHKIIEYCTCLYIDPLTLPDEKIKEYLAEICPDRSAIITEAKFIFRIPAKEDTKQ